MLAWNLTTSSSGTRPRSLTAMPWPLAQSRTADGQLTIGGCRTSEAPPLTA